MFGYVVVEFAGSRFGKETYKPCLKLCTRGLDAVHTGLCEQPSVLQRSVFWHVYEQFAISRMSVVDF